MATELLFAAAMPIAVVIGLNVPLGLDDIGMTARRGRVES
jgi:hypothetical protein